MKRLAGVTGSLAVLGLLATTSVAEAQSARAWAEAKNALPAGPTILIGVNLDTIRTSELYKTFVPAFIEKENDMKEGLGLIKSKCSIDATAVVQGVVVAMDDREKGAIFVSLKGVDEAAALDCLGKVAAAKDSKVKVTAKKTGNIVEYTKSDEKEKFYLAWLGKDVVAIATDPTDQALLKKMLGGGGGLAKSPEFGKALGKVNTNAALWGVGVKAEDLGPMKMKMAYGAADLAGGKISAEANIVGGSAKEVSDAAAAFNKDLEKAKKGGGVPPAMQGALNSVKITAASDVLVVTGQIAEKDVLNLLQTFMPR
jgi:hypothetical protein